MEPRPKLTKLHDLNSLYRGLEPFQKHSLPKVTSEAELVSKVESIEEYNARLDPFRKSFPGLPMLFPLTDHPAEEAMIKIFDGGKTEINFLLRKMNINLFQVSYARRTRPDMPAGNQHVILIETKDQRSERWAEAAQNIFKKFPSISTPLQVEIFNSDRMICSHSTALSVQPTTLLTDLMALRQGVLAVVQTVLQRHWTSIAFHHRTSHLHPTKSKMKPTIIIFCEAETVANFTSLLEAIKDKTSQVESSIEIEILPGKTSLSYHSEGRDPGVPSLDVRPWTERPHQGASIGISHATAAGTLGGYVWLQMPKASRIPCFLTSYEAIRSRTVFISQTQDFEGIPLYTGDGDMPGYPDVEYPAPVDIRFTRYLFDEEDEEEEKDEDTLTEEIDKIDKLADNAIIGRVIAASGWRQSAQNRRLNWALVRDTSDDWSPPRPAAKNILKIPELPFPYNIHKHSTMLNIGSIRAGGWVARKGRTSGWTTGKVNPMPRICNWPEKGAGKTTEEVEVFGLWGGFAEPGDMGAFVHDQRGDLVGMVLATDSDAAIMSIGLVTQIQEVMRDVRQVTGGGVISL